MIKLAIIALAVALFYVGLQIYITIRDGEGDLIFACTYFLTALTLYVVVKG